MSVLEVRDVGIRFGGLQALQDFSIAVNEWEIVGLIGPNGAGKTTAFNCITGFYQANTGSVTYRGRDVTRMPPHKKAAVGDGPGGVRRARRAIAVAAQGVRADDAAHRAPRPPRAQRLRLRLRPQLRAAARGGRADGDPDPS